MQESICHCVIVPTFPKIIGVLKHNGYIVKERFQFLHLSVEGKNCFKRSKTALFVF